MSAALQSLMRESEMPARAVQRDSGLLSFLVIGSGAALAFVLISTLAVALLPQLESWAVSSVCYAGLVVPVYLLHRRFSFRSAIEHRVAMPRYVAVQMMAMLLATLFGYLFHGSLGLPSLPAAILVTTLTSGINFVVLKGWAFAVPARLVAAAA